MEAYIEAITTLVTQLADIGKVIADNEVAELLLSGLPERYDVLVSGLETACLTSGLKSDLVKTRLLQEDNRRNGHEDTTAFFTKRRNNQLTCTYCKRQGHAYKRCFKRKRDQNKKTEPATHFAAAFSASTLNSQFIVDSGATNHMCCDENLVLNTTNRNSVISVANGQQLQSRNKTACQAAVSRVLKERCVTHLIPKMTEDVLPVHWNSSTVMFAARCKPAAGVKHATC